MTVEEYQCYVHILASVWDMVVGSSLYWDACWIKYTSVKCKVAFEHNFFIVKQHCLLLPRWSRDRRWIPVQGKRWKMFLRATRSSCLHQRLGEHFEKWRR